MPSVDWIAADWGTSTLRVWAMDSAGAVLAEARSADGMAGLAPEDFEPAFLRLAGDWLEKGSTINVIICGMAGSRQGWAEALYTPVPCPPFGSAAPTLAPTRDPRLRVHLLPGLSQSTPPDVMRGEETQILGVLARRSSFDGIICLPGTHSKWVHVSAGEVVSFATFMTGELFDLLSTRSVLRHTLTGGDWSPDAFAAALDETLSRPERVAAKLFSLRAETLLNGLPPGPARARLSGLLIGLELAGARNWWLGRDVVLVGAPALADIYAAALHQCGLTADRLDPTETTLDGLRAARSAMAKSGEMS